MSILDRLRHWRCENIGTEYTDGSPRERVAADDPDANLVSSQVDDEPGVHLVVLDIDMPCELRPSETPGHFHLIIDHRMSWERYGVLLNALAEARVVERGYVEASLNRGATFVALKPWKDER